MRLFRKKGFTLLELMIVIIIIGILASMALPRFITATRKARESEAQAILGSVRSAQLRYYLEYDQQYYSANNLDGLDIDITTSKYYTYRGANNTAGSVYIGQCNLTALGTQAGLKRFRITEGGAITTW